MSDFALLVFQRPVVIALALAGAGMATAGSLLAWRRGRQHRGAVWLTRLGYAVTFASVLIFIVAGYLSE